MTPDPFVRPPSPIAPPGACTGFKVVLHADGSLQLSWKSDNPSGARGTVYEVWRIAPGEEPSYVGTVGRKSIVDATVPMGTTRVTYRVRGVRSTAVGPWAEYNVNFGTPAPAPGSAAGSQGVPRMAA